MSGFVSEPKKIVFSTEDTKYLLLNILGHDVIHDYSIKSRFDKILEENESKKRKYSGGEELVSSIFNIKKKYKLTDHLVSPELNKTKNMAELKTETVTIEEDLIYYNELYEIIKINLLFYIYSFLFRTEHTLNSIIEIDNFTINDNEKDIPLDKISNEIITKIFEKNKTMSMIKLINELIQEDDINDKTNTTTNEGGGTSTDSTNIKLSEVFDTFEKDNLMYSFLKYIKEMAIWCIPETNNKENNMLHKEHSILYDSNSNSKIDNNLIDIFYQKYRIENNNNNSNSTINNISKINNFISLDTTNKKFIINNAASLNENIKKFVFCPTSSIFDPMRNCNLNYIENNTFINNNENNKRTKVEEFIPVLKKVFSFRKNTQDIRNNTDNHEEEVKKNTINTDNQNKIIQRQLLRESDDNQMNFMICDKNENIYYNGSYNTKSLRNTSKIFINIEIKLPNPKPSIIIKNEEFNLKDTEYTKNIQATNVLNKCLQQFFVKKNKFKINSTNYFDDVPRDNTSIEEYKYILLKGVGDLFQEVNAVCENGGYINNYNKDLNEGIYPYEDINPPPRLFLANDRPSACRFIFMLMNAQSGINLNAFGGYYPHNRENSLIVIRNDNTILNTGTRQGTNYNKNGGYKHKHKSTTRKRKSKSHKKKRKYKKTIKKISRNY